MLRWRADELRLGRERPDTAVSRPPHERRENRHRQWQHHRDRRNSLALADQRRCDRGMAEDRGWRMDAKNIGCGHDLHNRR